MQPTAKNVILDLLSTLRGGALPVRALIEAGALLEVGENAMRVQLARLAARGMLSRDERGQYRLAPATEAVQRRVAGWARIGERVVEWRGTWVAVHTAALSRADRRASRRRLRAFRFLGLRELTTGLWLRPNNLRGGVEEARRQLAVLGLEEAAPVCALADLDPATEQRARGLWDVAALVSAYRETRQQLDASRRRIADLTPEAAMTESFLLGGRAIRVLALDPLLPEPILPVAERQALVEAMRHYDRRGRACWRPFMMRHGAPVHRSPVHLRLTRAADELSAAAGSG